MVKKADSRSHDTVDRSMGPPFKVLLETNEIRHITIYQGRLTLGREQSRPGLTCGVIDRRILAAQTVRGRINEGEVGSKCACGDLIVIVRSTPTSDPTRRVWVPESTILEIRRVYDEES